MVSLVESPEGERWLGERWLETDMVSLVESPGGREVVKKMMVIGPHPRPLSIVERGAFYAEDLLGIARRAKDG